MKSNLNRSFAFCFCAILALLALAGQGWATPTITTQPVQRQVVTTTGTATFSVSAIGSGKLSYQWFHNGMAVTGGTSSSLKLKNVKYADAGPYQVKVTDLTGTGTSTAGFLNVLLQHPTVVAFGDNSSGQGNVPSALSGAVAIAAGSSHNLALKSDGTVVAWGDNSNGQTTAPPLSGIVSIAAGMGHSLALKSNGTVVAWGFSGTMPSDLSNVIAIAAGGFNSLALKSDGTVAAWGNHSTPAPTGLSGVVAIAAGSDHSIALKSDGTVVAWGYNGNGQSTVPPWLSGVVAIAAGSNHSIALKSNGTVVAWGDNYYGQTTIPSGLSGVVAIAGGGSQTFVLKSDGTVVAWGADCGGYSAVPAGLSDVVDIAAGGSFHCLALLELVQPTITSQPASVKVNIGEKASFSVTASGALLNYQWRKNGVAISSGTGAIYSISNAQRTDEGDYDVIVSNALGTGTSSMATLTVGGPTLTTHPVQSQVVTMSGSASFSVSAIGSGDLSYQWLHNGMAIAGGTSSTLMLSNVRYADAGAYQVKVTDSTGFVTSAAGFLNVFIEPVSAVVWGIGWTVPSGLGNITAIAGGCYHILALKSDGTVVAWGNNLYYQRTVPSGLTGVVSIAAGYFHSLALKSDGTVVAWGHNGNGQTTVPSGLSGAIAIAGGAYHSLALKSDGTVVAWGDNAYGQSGVPSGLNGVVAIAAGFYYSLALKSDGTVVAWGDTPTPAELRDVTAIAAGGYHGLALKSDATVVVWGNNYYGQTIIPPGLSSIIAIAGGSYHSLALKSDGTVVAWGRNDENQSNVPLGINGVVSTAGGLGYSLALQEQPPAPPTTISASDNDLLCAGRVHVTWTAVVGASNYRVFRATSATEAKVAISTWQSDTSFYDTTATRGSVYHYWVVAARDASGFSFSDYSAYDTGSAALTATDVFSNWMAAHGVSGSPASTFAADRDADGVTNGLEYAFGANRSPSEPAIVLSRANGSLMVGMLKQADDTLPYVDLAIKCSTNLQDWNYPLIPATNTTGMPGNRSWYEPEGMPEKAFFRLESAFKPDP